MHAMTSWRAGDPWDPGNPENREQTRRLAKELRQRLLDWDPIGVAGAAEAQDEYDCLISPLMHQLHDGATARDIGDWLIREMTDHFGMSADKKRERALASELKRWWESVTSAPGE